MRKTRTKEQPFVIKLAVCFAIATLAGGPMLAADISAGYSFTPTDRVTSTKLNNLVGAGTINSSFYTDKSAAQPVGADTLLFYSAASAVFKKATYNALLLQNTNLIVGQSEDTSPTTNDYVLTWDQSANLLKKVALASIWTNANALATQVRSTNAPLPGTLFLGSSNSVYNAYALTNLFQEWWRWMAFSTNVAQATTNLPNSLLSFHTAPTNLDQLLIWDSLNSTNKASTLIGLLTNLPSVSANKLTNSDYLLLVSYATNANNPFGTNPTVSKILVTNLTRVFTSAGQPLPNSAGATTWAHGLAGKPQFVRCVAICTNVAGDIGYSLNDEVDVMSAMTLSANTPGAVIVDSTSVIFANSVAGGTWQTKRKDTGATATMTPANWNLKAYAKYVPW